MNQIRHHLLRLTVATALLSAAALSGCTTPGLSTPTTLAVEPPADALTQLRDWPVAASTYEDGSVDAGWNPFRYIARDSDKRFYYLYAEPAVFVANAVTMPYTIYQKRRETGVEYQGVVLPPSSTIVSPLPEASPSPITPPQLSTTAPSELIRTTPTTQLVQ